MNRCRYLVFLATCMAAGIALAASRVAAAPPSTPPKPAAKSLDEELLEGLDSKLQNGIGEKPAADVAKKPMDNPSQKAPDQKRPTGNSPTKKTTPLDPLDEQLERSLSGGEDLGSPSEDEKNPLARIVVQMRQVQQRLADKKSDRLTQGEQRQISDELKALVEQLAQQSQQQQSQNSQSASQQASRDKPKQGNGLPGKAPPGDSAKLPSRDSSTKLRPNHAERPDPAAARDVVRKELDRLHLPDKDREEMLQGAPDEFLPGHESSIEQYFKRLVEQEDERH